MKNIKQKDEPNIQKLTGEPGANDVSLVAMGQEPSNGMEAEFEENEKMFMGKLGFGKNKEICQDIDDAYAQLFESLSVIIRSGKNG